MTEIRRLLVVGCSMLDPGYSLQTTVYCWLARVQAEFELFFYQKKNDVGKGKRFHHLPFVNRPSSFLNHSFESQKSQ